MLDTLVCNVDLVFLLVPAGTVENGPREGVINGHIKSRCTSLLLHYRAHASHKPQQSAKARATDHRSACHVERSTIYRIWIH